MMQLQFIFHMYIVYEYISGIIIATYLLVLGGVEAEVKGPIFASRFPLM